jgi:hypothetical protein
MDQIQPRQKVSEILSQQTKPIMVAFVSDPNYMGSIGGKIVVWGQLWAKNARPYLKNNLKGKRDGGMT